MKSQGRKRRLSFVIFVITIALSSPVFALPEGAVVENGSASFDSPDDSTLNITTSDSAVINFDSFNIAENESVNFIQPSSSSTLLSRVIGGSASFISGNLAANGIFFLVNTHGIHFTQNANVSAATFVASALDISTNNFLNSNYVFQHPENGKYAQIINEGTIKANNVALMASAVDNSGIIIAKAGTVHLASGDKTTLAIDARGLIQIEINEETSGKVVDENGNTVKEAVANSGTIEAAQVIMSAATADEIFENAINQTGIVRATGLTEENGIIRMVANQNIKLAGTLEVASSQSPVSQR